jgi:hypothetical protein
VLGDQALGRACGVAACAVGGTEVYFRERWNVGAVGEAAHGARDGMPEGEVVPFAVELRGGDPVISERLRA